MSWRPIAALLIVLAAGAGGWAWTHRGAPKLEGGVILQRLQCHSSGGVARVQALATNATNRNLKNLVARVTIGADGDTKTADVTFSTALKGGSIRVEQDIPYAKEINVCAVRFWWNGSQLPTAFRP